MPVHVVCPACQADYNLKDEFAGLTLKCPRCQNVISVPDLEPQAAGKRPAFSDEIDPAFQHNKFLLRQRYLTLQEQYDVRDQDGVSLMFVERPVHWMQNMSAGCLAFVAMLAIMGGSVALGVAIIKGQEGLGITIIILGLVLGLVAFVAIFLALMAKRHITFYGDKSKSDLLLEILQDYKFTIINASFTVLDHNGEILARFRKNYLHNIFRRRWYGYLPDGTLFLVAKEDSVILALLRRFFGPLYGILRTNYAFFKPDQETVVGEFNRKFTLLDRFVLDLSRDRDGYLDHRLAVAQAVLIDTNEKV